MGAAQLGVCTKILQHIMKRPNDSQTLGKRPHTGVFIQGLEHVEDLGVMREEPEVEECSTVR